MGSPGEAAGFGLSSRVFFCSCDIWLFGSHRILALEKLGAVFNQVAFPLQYTPRKFVIHPESSNLIIIETDHNAYTEATKAQRKQQMAEVAGGAQCLSAPLLASFSIELLLCSLPHLHWGGGGGACRMGLVTVLSIRGAPLQRRETQVQGLAVAGQKQFPSFSRNG